MPSFFVYSLFLTNSNSHIIMQGLLIRFARVADENGKWWIVPSLDARGTDGRGCYIFARKATVQDAIKKGQNFLFPLSLSPSLLCVFC